jgi:hypothetical protein
METKTYQIGDKKYSQNKLVLGQIRQLLGLLKDAGLLQGKEILIPTQISTKDLIDFLTDKGDLLAKWIAIILKEDGTPLAKKDLETMTSEIDFSIEPESAMEVIRDFFDFLDLISLSKNIKAMMGEIETRMMDQIGSKKPSSSSPEEI